MPAFTAGMVRHLKGRRLIDSKERHDQRQVVSKLELPARTIARVIITLVIIWLLTRLWSVLLLGFIALLVAAALDPAVRRLERRGFKRPLAVGTVFLTLVAGIVLVLGLVVPPLIDDGREFAQELPGYVDDAQSILNQNPDIYQRLHEASQRGAADPTAIFGGLLTFSFGLIGAISNTLIVLVLAIYILVDGARIYSWMVRYLPVKQRERLDRAIPEVSSVVSGYVAGQTLTSALFGIFTFILLTALDVPQALFLAILAAFADAIPIAGVVIATIPAVLLAFSVSVPAAIIVFAAYMVYQQIENYIIVPRVYKNTLQISSFAVLVAVLVGGELLGIIGVLLALPIAAAVPVLERIWIGDDHPWLKRARKGETPESAVQAASTDGWPR
jgi:predicted PurR-regulated permease PerM